MTNAIDAVGNGYSFGGNATTVIDGLCTYSVQGIVTELCIRAGMDPSMIDTSQLFGLQCRGFTVVNQYPCTSSLQALSNVFMFDPSNYDGVVHFVLRGADTVATITQDSYVITQTDTGADDPLQDQSERADSVQIPQTLNLNYFDVEGGLATSLQSSQRIGDPRATGSQDLQTAVILNADEAARVIKINHAVMVEDAKSQINFTVTDQYLALTVADCIFVPYDDKVYRCRITQIDMDDGQQALQMLQDRQSAVVSNIQGFPAAIPTPPPSVVVGPTLIQPIDIHIISDNDDSLGCYLAIGASVDSWKGALIEVSLDGGATYFNSFYNYIPSICGTLRTALGSHLAEYPDAVNTCSVVLLNPNDALEAASETQMLNGINLAIVGNEVVQFGNVDESGTPGTWTVGYWFRGRKGTTATAHAMGERFVVLDRNTLMFVPMQLAYVGRSLTVRATSLNGTPSDVTTVTFTYTGQSQVEYPVAYLQARRSGSDGVISWQGVGKLGSGASVAMGLHFAGYVLTLTDGSTTQTYSQTASTLTTSLAAFSGPITVTVVAVNNLTGNGPATAVTF